jgi:hypothetical protein
LPKGKRKTVLKTPEPELADSGVADLPVIERHILVKPSPKHAKALKILAKREQALAKVWKKSI